MKYENSDRQDAQKSSNDFMGIAFIGLGHMGGPMAANLVSAGYSVTGFDVVPAALEAAAAAGVVVAESSAAAALGADVIITMLPAGKHVFAAFEGDGPGGGLLAAAKPGALFLECSTISVEDARTAHEMVVSGGHRGLDAPVSGGVVGAEGGTLTFMVGGSEEDFAAAAPSLRSWGGGSCTAAGQAPDRQPRSATT